MPENLPLATHPTGGDPLNPNSSQPGLTLPLMMLDRQQPADRRDQAVPYPSTSSASTRHNRRNGVDARRDEFFRDGGSEADAGDVSDAIFGYDFSRFGVIADIGGGRVHLLRAVLDATPGAEGVLFDLPEVIEELDFDHDRLTAQAGGFFADQLPQADVYLLMEVLHDWLDPQAVKILQAIQRAASPGASVLVIENVGPDLDPDPRGHTLDIIMLAVTGGRERTLSELSQLFSQASLTDPTIIQTNGPLRIAAGQAPVQK